MREGGFFSEKAPSRALPEKPAQDILSFFICMGSRREYGRAATQGSYEKDQRNILHWSFLLRRFRACGREPGAIEPAMRAIAPGTPSQPSY